MQPYQRASEKIKNEEEEKKNYLKKAVFFSSYGLGLGAGASAFKSAGNLLGRIAPFLSDYIPWDMAKKGMEKADPRMGKFISGAEKEGFEPDQIKQFIESKIGPEIENQNKPTLTKKNIIEQYSPELHQFILNEIKKGRTPSQAAAALHVSKEKNKFDPIIKKIQKDHKADWLSIVESIYGGQNVSNTSQEKLQGLSTGMGQMAKGVTDKFYEGIYQSLVQGKDTFSGVKDPLIQKIKPYYEQGLINSPEDIKRIVNSNKQVQSTELKQNTMAAGQPQNDFKEMTAAALEKIMRM